MATGDKLVTLDELKAVKDYITPSHIGAKATQTAVSSPTASGTTTSFIDTISQDAQGKITATKKTVQNASTSVDGLMSSTDKSKLDGIATGAQVNSITGVKGNAESSYRTGNVNITPANIGALSGTVAIANGGTGVTDEQSMHEVVFNNTRTTGWTAYPTAAGLYRTTGTLWTGMPTGANKYGVLTIFGCGGYYMHQYADADGNLYYAETGSMTAPDTKWKKIFSTNTAVKITEGGTGATTAAAARTNLGIQKGEISIASTAAGTYSDTTVTFGSTFTSTPTVVVGFRSGSSSANLGSCSCSVVPTSVTTTGCTVRFFNNGSTAVGPGVAWIAIG